VEELKDPYRTCEALKTELLTQLIICINKTQPVIVKRDASECLIYVSKINKGRSMIFDMEFLGNIFNLLFDDDEIVKIHGYEILYGLSDEFVGREKVANEGVIKKLIELLNLENNNIKKYILHLLSILTYAKVGTQLFLINDGITKTKQLLHNDDYQIVFRIIHLYQKLSIPDIGKKDLLKNKCVVNICNLLMHTNKGVRRETLKTLSFLARESEAKFIIIGKETTNDETKYTKQDVLNVNQNKHDYL